MPVSGTVHRKIDGTERLELSDPTVQLPSAFPLPPNPFEESSSSLKRSLSIQEKPVEE